MFNISPGIHEDVEKPICYAKTEEVLVFFGGSVLCTILPFPPRVKIYSEAVDDSRGTSTILT